MHSEITDNKRKSVAIMAAFFALVGGLVWLLYQNSGSYPLTVGVLIGAGVYALVTYFGAGSLAVAVNGAQEVDRKSAPRLYKIVENLTITEGMPMPKVYIMDDQALNAFATGRDPQHAIVCATTGLLDMMTDTELEGVMAHELGHIKNYDIRVSMIAFGLTIAVSIVADTLMRSLWWRDRDDNNRSSNGILMIVGIVAALLAPLVASLIRLAISRQREYLADATGAMTTHYPEGLARALEKLQQYGTAVRRQNTATAHMFIANPLSGASVAQLFSTHPPLEQRIKILREMDQKV